MRELSRKPPGEAWWGLTSEQAEAVAKYRVTAATIRKWLERGLIKRNEFGRIDVKEFEAFLDKRGTLVSQ